MSAIQQQLGIVGARVARDTQLAVLSAVSASLENIKEITAASNQQPAQSAALPQGVGGKIDLSA